MKTLVLSLALLTLPASMMAQAPTADNTPVPAAVHRANPHRAAAKLAHKLGLNADQQARLEPILAARRQKVDAVRANTQLSDVDRKQQLKSIHRETRTEMSSVLTPDQMQRMKAMHHAKHTPVSAPTGV